MRFFWPAKTSQKILRLGGVVLIVVIASRFLVTEVIEETPDTNPQPPAVSLVTAAAVADSQSNSYIGTVRAISEAEIQTEVSGRVTAVNVRPGDTVTAGAIIATLENAAQRAAVLQAEGAYEQALAGAAQTDVSVSSAERSLTQAYTSAFNVYQSGYTTTQQIVRNTLDQFFRDPQGIPSLVVATGENQALARQRAALVDTLENWQQVSTNEIRDDEILNRISTARTTVETVLQMTDAFLSTLDGEPLTKTINGTPVSTYVRDLNTARASLIAQLNSFDQAENQIAQAIDALEQARIAGTGQQVSSADAQVKSALGSLRAAQAQLAKTILRSPISGTVNDVAVNVGDFVSSFTPIAEVANNGSLEVQFFATQSDATQLTVGQAVTIDGAATGTIVSIAPAVNQATQKTEIRAAVAGTALTNGSTVRISPVRDDRVVVTDELFLPITAVRFTAEDGFVFVVDENGTLTQQGVTLGDIRGTSVEIRSGIEASTAVVDDARGLSTGESVTVVTE